jgi:hypothetical protein
MLPSQHNNTHRASGEEKDPIPLSSDSLPPSKHVVSSGTNTQPAQRADQLHADPATQLANMKSSTNPQHISGANATSDSSQIHHSPVVTDDNTKLDTTHLMSSPLSQNPVMEAASNSNPVAPLTSYPIGNPPMTGSTSYTPIHDGEKEPNQTVGSGSQYHSSNSHFDSATSRSLLSDAPLTDHQPQDLPVRRLATSKLLNIGTQPEPIQKSFGSTEDIQQASKCPARSISNTELDSAGSDGGLYTPKSSPMRPYFQTSEQPESIHSPFTDSGNPPPKECVLHIMCERS